MTTGNNIKSRPETMDMDIGDEPEEDLDARLYEK
jgi:hypothetical protein